MAGTPTGWRSLGIDGSNATGSLSEALQSRDCLMVAGKVNDGEVMMEIHHEMTGLPVGLGNEMGDDKG
jgi:hypothetical protein